MSELSEKEIKFVKAMYAAVGGGTSAEVKPKGKAVEEADPDNLEMDEEKILAMDIDELRELAERIGLEGTEKMALKALRTAILEFGQSAAPEPAEADTDEPKKPAKKAAPKEDDAAEFEVGQKVVAKWDNDGKWYDAKVLTVDEEGTGKMKVKFIADQVVQNTKVANVKQKPKADE